MHKKKTFNIYIFSPIFCVLFKKNVYWNIHSNQLFIIKMKIGSSVKFYLFFSKIWSIFLKLVWLLNIDIGTHGNAIFLKKGIKII